MSNFNTSSLEKKREKALQLQKEQALQQDKKRTYHLFYAIAFGVFIFLASLGAKIVFKPANASMWAIGGLVISFVVRLAFPHTKRAGFKALKMFGDMTAVVFIFLSLHDIYKQPINSTPILLSSCLISLLAGLALYREL
ncbi:hypothetical protein V462_11195 [Pantoea ananatis 15320]|uniref:hypothetical protein n=1 Tax=Pantoea ananas TaxID=553 RepID=UPI000467659D|nr:hypothetical protein [Pantoea ananatis]PKC36137.1 hypothetical protein V462_11195 [Pantoea ananatis 15320]